MNNTTLERMRVLKHIDNDMYKKLSREPDNIKIHLLNMYFNQMGRAIPYNVIKQLQDVNKNMHEVVQALHILVNKLDISHKSLNLIDTRLTLNLKIINNIKDLDTLRTSIDSFLTINHNIESIIRQIIKLNKIANTRNQFTDNTIDIFIEKYNKPNYFNIM